MRALLELRRGEPGRRFHDYYERRHGRRPRKLVIALAVVISALGLVLAPTPGPGIPLIAIGMAMLAAESEAAACALDWLELRLRRLFFRNR
jgi:hypothetical protein